MLSLQIFDLLLQNLGDVEHPLCRLVAHELESCASSTAYHGDEVVSPTVGRGEREREKQVMGDEDFTQMGSSVN